MKFILLAAGAVVAAAVVLWLVFRAGGGESGSYASGAGEKRGENPGASEAKRNWIVGRRGDVEGKSFHMGQRTVTIGRKPTNFIQVADSEASRVHCQLKTSGARAALVDMNSSAGTYLNGEELRPNEEYLLEDGDRFEVASVEFEYRVAGDFEENYGITAPKTTGQKFETSTKLGAGSEWRETLEQALSRADGDPQAAADELGVDLEVFMQLMEQTDLGDD